MNTQKRNVLVCITPQTNSKRLIDRGGRISEGGRLHILHVQKGISAFDETNASLLEELFTYGKTKGGTVHFLSGDNFYVTVKVFVIRNKITHMVLGEPPAEIMSSEELVNKISEEIPGIEVIVLERPKN